MTDQVINEATEVDHPVVEDLAIVYLVGVEEVGFIEEMEAMDPWEVEVGLGEEGEVEVSEIAMDPNKGMQEEVCQRLVLNFM